ncbi:MAG: hypothetical protein IKN89_01490 [Oscillospiraceae bacterium]|nr:hypothetical protein [Oscillospiraceae bacterium]MBR3554561.1 hypothetical protein [Oscillospiraceae bacterium]
MNHVEKLAARYAEIPRIEDTGPKNGRLNGEAMARLALRSRLVYGFLCILGLIPILIRLFGGQVSPQLVAMGFGCFVPGGGFIACGGVLTIAFGLFVTWYLWKKKAMWWQDIYGTAAGILGFWLIGILGGLLARPGLGSWLVAPNTLWPFWGWLLAVADAALLWGRYEYRVHQTKKLIYAARQERLEHFDESIRELDAVIAKAAAEKQEEREMDEDQLKLARWLLNASVRELGDFSGFDHFKRPVLTDNRYQFPTVGYALLLMQCKYVPNFRGYLAQAQRFIVDAITDPRTCGYWKKTNLIGYMRWDPDPIKRANIMLSGWMLPTITGYGAQTHDRCFEEEGALRFRPFKNDPSRSYDYSAKGAVECLYRQYKEKEFPYMLIPCEPHVAFPICNSYGLLGMLIYDRDHGTHYCEEIWEDLYKYLTDNFVEAEGSIALRRQDIYGLRFIPESQMGYDPMADVQNYLMYAPIFPGLARRNYAILRRHALEVRDGVTYIKGRKWEDIFDMATQKKNPSLVMSNLEMLAAEYGDKEILDGLHRAESIFLERSRDPRYFRFKDVPLVVMANFAIGRFLQQGDWQDMVLRGPAETAFTGPLLTGCDFPQVLVAKAMSHGEDLDLVLYNGEGSGPQALTVENLIPGGDYLEEHSGQKLQADAEGKLAFQVHLDGRTPVHLVRA